MSYGISLIYADGSHGDFQPCTNITVRSTGRGTIIECDDISWELGVNDTVIGWVVHGPGIEKDHYFSDYMLPDVQLDTVSRMTFRWPNNMLLTIT